MKFSSEDVNQILPFNGFGPWFDTQMGDKHDGNVWGWLFFWRGFQYGLIFLGEETLFFLIVMLLSRQSFHHRSRNVSQRNEGRICINELR